MTDVGLFCREAASSNKAVNLLDKVAMRIFAVEAVDLGAVQSRLADALGITRQTIHNYREIRKYFGTQESRVLTQKLCGKHPVYQGPVFQQ